MPKVTIITGYYNRADALGITIDSIMNQSYEDFEFIIFNDCSTDNTIEELEKIQLRYNDPRIIVKNHRSNTGFVQGLINCINESTGEYICIQGSGDYSFPDRVKKQVSLLDTEEGVVLVGSNYQNYIEDKNIIRTVLKNEASINKDNLLKENFFSHGEVMFVKSAYFKVGGYRNFFINCQDYDLWLRMISCGRFRIINEVLYRRYIRYDGVSYKPDKFLKQLKYEDFCRTLNSYSSKEQVEILLSAQKIGISETVDSSKLKLQFKILKAVLRSMAWNKFDEARELTALGINSNLIRFILNILISIYSSNSFSKPRKLIEKKLGLKIINK